MRLAKRLIARPVGRVVWCLPLMLGLVLVRPSVSLQAAPNLAAVADAARADDLSEVRKLIKDHGDVNTAANDGSSALLWAAYHSDVEMTKALLAAGATVDAANHYGVTPLLQASRNGNVEVMRALLDAGADPNLKAHISTITERSHADHPSGGFTALMFAVRNGHEDVAKALIAGGADLKLTNADGASAAIVAIVNGRFELAKEFIELGSDPNDGSLFFAVDMHDATTDMRAHDGSRLQPNHPNKLTALGLVKVLLDLKADVNKPFVGALHSTTLCCGASINSSPFYRAATAADVEVLKLMLAPRTSANAAKIEWSPAEIKPKDGKGPGRPNPNAGRTPLMAAIKGGQGAPIAGGPGFTRIGPPVFREPGSRDPIEAIQLLLAAGANPNVKAADGSTPLHQAVQEEHVGMIRALAAAGGKLDAVNKDNLTPLLLAEAPKKPNPADMGDLDVYKPKRNSKEEVVAALRELMHLGPNDPAPQPPPLPKEADKKAADDKEKKDNPKTAAVKSAP